MPPGGEPQIVPEAKYRPGKCLASGDTEGPFIDCGRWTREHDPYLQLSVRWVEETAQGLLGMVSKREVDERYAKLEAQLVEQAERIKELDRFEEATAEFEKARQVVISRNAGPEARPPDGNFARAVYADVVKKEKELLGVTRPEPAAAGEAA